MCVEISDRSCCGGLCRGLKWSLVFAGGSVGKSSQAWWHSPPHRRPPWGLGTLWHIRWRYRGFHTFSTYSKARHHQSRRCSRLGERGLNSELFRDLPGGVKLMVLGSCYQFWVNTNVFKHRLNGKSNTKFMSVIVDLQKLLWRGAEGITSSLSLLPRTFPCSPSCCNGSADRTQSCTGTCRRDGGRVSRRWRAGGLGKPPKHALEEQKVSQNEKKGTLQANSPQTTSWQANSETLFCRCFSSTQTFAPWAKFGF